MSEPTERELAAAKEWTARPGRGGDAFTLAAIIHKHMNPMSSIDAAGELHAMFLNEWKNLSSVELMDKTIAIIERTGRTVSDAE